ncbi:hypothetical protein EXIGLDRAFT_722792 [Exidia glandulosa HHB12029]|uniref:Uncharacterized protein n=1 Tax=Exidia glandulosa HHB12029 TaxID=1314781 RepID=A0A166A4D0_EXIGL|nr:hypothetical protein EXIGLDRAFT_722792 [Exidia glandulosa HHB12029]
MSLDGKVSTVTTMLTMDSPITRQALIWTAEGLDADQQHELVVTMLDGIIIDVDRVDITLSDATATSSTQPGTSTPTGEPSSHTGRISPRTIAAIVGGAAGAMVLLFIILLLCLWRRKVKQNGGDVTCPFERLRSRSQEEAPPVSEVGAEHGHDPQVYPSPLHVVPPVSSDPLRDVFIIEPSPDYPLRHSVEARRSRHQRRASKDEGVPRYTLVRTASNRPLTVLVAHSESDPLATPEPSPQPSPSTELSSEIHFTPHRDIRHDDVEP